MSKEDELGMDLLVEAAKAVGTGAYNDLKEKFLKKWGKNEFKKKYGFLPQNYEFIASEIQDIGQKTYFKCLKECIGKKHWALDHIKVGITISELGGKGDIVGVNEIRKEIRKNKGSNALNIVKMGSTGAIMGVINYLDALRRGDYSQKVIVEEFEKIISEWLRITVFVRKEDSKVHIGNIIKAKLSNRLPLIFVFSYGFDANSVAMHSISDLRNEGEIEPEDYILESLPSFDGVGTEIYMWTFTLC